MVARARIAPTVEQKIVGSAITLGRAVKLNGFDQWVPAGIGDAAVGVAQSAPGVGLSALAVVSGPCDNAVAAEAFNGGVRVAPAAGGKFRVAQPGDEITGVALDRSDGDNDVFRMLVDSGGGTADAEPTGGGGGGGTGTVEATYTCPVSVAVGDVVRVTGSDSVDKADAASLANRAVGIVTSKPTTTSAVVRSAGDCSVFSGLTPGDDYFLSTTPGAMTNAPDTSVGKVLQRLGVAKTSSVLSSMVERDVYLF
mgnify:CR=1 FL=1